MYDSTPDSYSYSAENYKRIEEIQQLIGLQPIYKMLELLKDMNAQLAILEWRLRNRVVGDENEN